MSKNASPAPCPLRLVDSELTRFADRLTFVTGGASGIGAAIAERCSDEGSTVLIIDVDAEAGEGVAARCGNRSRFVQLDVTDDHGWLALARSLGEGRTPLHGLVNNAAVRVDAEIEALSLAEWNRALATNLTGTFLAVKHLLPALRSAGNSSIVNVGSVAALVGFEIAPAYQASKSALRAFTRHIAARYARDGVRANCLHPGLVDTPMSRTLDSAEKLHEIQRTPQRRIADADEIAAAAAFLLSSDSRFVTGTDLVADGGYTAI
jgi:NAD(P)-dependent dehydrogenase (short-subunit alcohol dehydrogenase family)